jgi:hypothetical protein
MRSAANFEIRDDDGLVGRVDQRSAAELRRMEEQELRLAEQTDLPMVRAKHRQAAERWAQMAADRGRVEENARYRADIAIAAEAPAQKA